MLRCPVCKKTDMAVLELHDVEIDYCFGCAGIWLDAGELELLLETAEKKDEILEAFTDVTDKKIKEKKRLCHICKKAMKKIVLNADNKEIMVDKCVDGHGIWFDKGELYEIINLSTDKKAHPVLLFLKDIFNYETCEKEDN